MMLLILLVGSMMLNLFMYKLAWHSVCSLNWVYLCIAHSLGIGKWSRESFIIWKVLVILGSFIPNREHYHHTCIFSLTQIGLAAVALEHLGIFLHACVHLRQSIEQVSQLVLSMYGLNAFWLNWVFIHLPPLSSLTIRPHWKLQGTWCTIFYLCAWAWALPVPTGFSWSLE